MRQNISGSCLTGISDEDYTQALLLAELPTEDEVYDQLGAEFRGNGTARCRWRSREDDYEELQTREPQVASDNRDEREELCEQWSNSSSECNRSERGGSVEKRHQDAAAAIAAARLPEEVVERILAMIPFPYLLKVRILSKEWHRKFPRSPQKASTSSTGSRMDQRTKKERNIELASPGSFRSIVSSVSTNWLVYSPVIIGNEGLIGYDSAHNIWQTLTTNFQKLLGSCFEPWLINSCGPLICGVSQSPGSEYDVVVTNAITRSWRKLPARPNTRIPSLLNVMFDDSEGYKVFLLIEDPYEGPHNEVCTGHHSVLQSTRCVTAQVFSSVDDEWTMSQAIVPSATSFAWRSCSVAFNGNIYCLSGDDRNPIDHPLQAWVYNSQEKLWAEIEHPFGELKNSSNGTSVTLDLTRFRLFVSGDKLLVVLALDPKQPYDHQVASDTLFIYELDPETRIISERSRGPPYTVLANSEHIASDGANIYFCTLDLLICYPVIVYNIKSGLWHCLAPDFKTAGPLTNKRWADFAFQPGLNPFMSP